MYFLQWLRLGFAVLIGTVLLAACGGSGPAEPRSIQGLLVSKIFPTPPDYLSDAQAELWLSEHGAVPPIYVPGVYVTITDANGNALGKIPSDLSGRFYFNQVKPGDYTICWSADNFQTGCLPKPVTVSTKNLHLGKIAISPARDKKGYSLYGKVRFMDGENPRHFDFNNNVNAFATVTAENNGAVVGEAYVNNYGNYILPQLPVKTDLVINVEVENTGLKRHITSDVAAPSSFTKMDIYLQNETPKLRPLTARNSSDQRIRVAEPGEEVFVKALPTNEQTAPLKYKWHVPPGSGSISSNTDSSIAWKLPKVEKDLHLILTAYDEKGAYNKQVVVIRTAEKREGIIFSGFVKSSTGAMLANATVNVAGKTTTTDNVGFFSVSVTEKQRYVLHIEHKDHAFFSQIYNDGVRGGRWMLYKAQKNTNLDPTQEITVVDNVSPELCIGSISSNINWKTAGSRGDVVFQDGNGKNIAGKLDRLTQNALTLARSRYQCGPGITVRIPANSLEDSAGNPVTNKVDITLSTIDINAPNAMPGDYTVIDNNGNERVMQSYGAGTVQVNDSINGAEYNIKAGAFAEVTIPVSPIQLAATGPLPNTIPYLIYNEQTGEWHEHTQAQLTPDKKFYIAKAKHFSAANMDLIKVDQSCVRLDATALPGTFKKIEVIVPDPNGAAPRIITRDINNSGSGNQKFHAVYNLPSNTDIFIIPIRVDDSSDSEPDQPFGTFAVNTGAPQTPTTPNEPKFECDPGDGCISPDKPYGACANEIVLYDVGAPQDPGDVFLAGLLYSPVTAAFLADLQPELVKAEANGTDFADAVLNASQKYYETIDPHNRRRNLDDFRTTNGLTGNNEVHAIYANSADLGFGRDMYCRKDTTNCHPNDANDCDVACYVTNYIDGANGPDFDSDDSIDFTLVVDANNNPNTGPNSIATVAMEYSRLDDPNNANGFISDDRVVKFYVYFGDGNDDGIDDSGDPNFPDGSLLLNANLDGNGERPIPQLCMVCHGGQLTKNNLDVTAPAFDPADPTTADLGSVFLPFDLEAFTFVDDYDVTWNKANQQQAFKDLNQIVYDTQPATGTALKEIHDKLYANWVDANPATHEQDDDFVATGWQGNADYEQAYRTIVAPSCRACHTAQHLSDLTFATANGFISSDTIDDAVCNLRVMPHAKATYERFWLSLNPNQPGLLDNFGTTHIASAQAPWLHCAETPPVEVGALVYDPVIQDIFNSNGCLGCHSADLQLGGFVLTYNNLFNNSNEVPGMPYITAGNPDNSYLFHKINNTHTSNAVGGSGDRMPPPPNNALDGSVIDVIEQWILDGAPEN